MEARRPAPSQPGRGLRPGAGSSGRRGSGPHRVCAAHSAAQAPRSERALLGPRGPGCTGLHKAARGCTAAPAPLSEGEPVVVAAAVQDVPGWELGGVSRSPARPACSVPKDKDVENGPGLPLADTHLVLLDRSFPPKVFNLKETW